MWDGFLTDKRARSNMQGECYVYKSELLLLNLYYINCLGVMVA
jgi:hypothetical protein